MSFVPYGTILKGLMNIADTWLEYTDEDSRLYKNKKVAAQRMLDPLQSIPTKMMGAIGLDTDYRRGDTYPIDDFGALVEMIGNLGMGGGSGAGASSAGMGQGLNAIGGLGGLISMVSNKGQR